MKAPPRLAQVNVVCADVARSVRFYRRLGLDLPDPVAKPDGVAFLSNLVDETGFSLDLDSEDFARVWNAGWAGAETLAGKTLLGIRVAARDEVDRLHAEMTAAGYRSLQAPCDAFWGPRFAIIEDPDGVAVGLMSPRDDTQKKGPLPNF